MTCNLQVEIARAPLWVCLQCPLCCNLVHEATTISECLHTFCRSCIYQLLSDGENNSCPICNVSLGCLPLEKLRTDHQLDDICTKLFPVKIRSKGDIKNNTDADSSPLSRRKERSLSSLGIGSAPTSHHGFLSRRAKSISRKSVKIRDNSTDGDLDDRKADKYCAEEVIDKASREDSSLDNRAVSADLLHHHEVENSQRKEDIFGDEQSADEAIVQQTMKREHTETGRNGILPQWAKETCKVPPIPSCNPDFKLGNFLPERSKLSASGLLQFQISEATNSSDRLLISRKHANSDDAFLVPVCSTNSGMPDGSLVNQSPLAHLAEVAVDQAGHTEYLYLPKARGPRARRERGKNESAKSSAMGGSLSWQTMLENIRSAAALPGEKQNPAILSSGKTLPPLEKPPTVLPSTNASKRGQSPASALAAKLDGSNVGFWFSLEAADNQFVDNALPQLSRRYLRIKDGKLPVSSVKKYLVNKLDLQSEAEVEITCRGQPVVPNLPLEKVQGIWLATTPASMELLPALRETNTASQDDRSWAHYKARSAKDCIMVLTYSRHRRHLVAP